jgi:PAS domain-containing protein
MLLLLSTARKDLVENEFNRVINVLLGMIWGALPEGNVDFVNRYWCEYTGVGVGETCGRGWQTAIHLKDRSIIESHHGLLWAQPNDGPGATVFFSLPCAIADRNLHTNQEPTLGYMQSVMRDL